MKKTKDFTKVIGFINRGGMFSPSNETSQKKYEDLYAGYSDGRIAPPTMNKTAFDSFVEAIGAFGYTVMVARRGLNR